jgi:peptidoglycan/LPS O-acetylase OafA/YrhL
VSADADQLPGLDLLRSLAIVWVMLFHSFLLGGLGPDWAWLSRFGWMGVDLFFVLSGFLIGTQVLAPLAQGGRLSLADFYLRRALRILPAYWAVLLLYLLWPGWREAPGMEPAWKFLAFVVNLDIDYGRHAAFSHAWSLCVEEHFYWLFPVLAAALLRRPSARRCVALVAALVLGGIALRTALWLHGMAADPLFERSNWYVEDLYYPTWTRLDGLLCGVALAAFKVYRPTAWQRARQHANLSLAAGLVVLTLAFRLFQDRVGLAGNAVGWPVLSIGMGLLVFAGAGRDSWIGRWSLAPAGWLAAISYSLYLVHKAAYHVVQAQWGEQLAGQGIVAFVVYGSTAVLAGTALHLVVERPCLKLRQRANRGTCPACLTGRPRSPAPPRP